MGASGSNPNPEEDPHSDLLSRSEQSAAGTSLILIVEDNTADVFLIRQAIESAGINSDVRIVTDGEQATRFFDMVDADAALTCPALVVLDINLPRRQGGEVLEHMRKSRRCSNALVIAVSTSDSARDREEMQRLGADGYFRKPSDYEDFMKLGGIVRGLLNIKPSRA